MKKTRGQKSRAIVPLRWASRGTMICMQDWLLSLHTSVKIVLLRDYFPRHPFPWPEPRPLLWAEPLGRKSARIHPWPLHAAEGSNLCPFEGSLSVVSYFLSFFPVFHLSSEKRRHTLIGPKSNVTNVLRARMVCPTPTECWFSKTTNGHENRESNFTNLYWELQKLYSWAEMKKDKHVAWTESLNITNVLPVYT